MQFTLILLSQSYSACLYYIVCSGITCVANSTWTNTISISGHNSRNSGI